MQDYTWRGDIDGLRAVAVLSVILFHAFPRQVAGGYIGVDIFFVISGFLISSIIFRSLNRKNFTFYDFYSRRVRRIFPALILVLASCYAFGWHTLLANEYEELGEGIAGGAGFVSNFVLWSGTGYFDSAAELKPLLHLWSLSIEEQFYIFWPLLLWLSWKFKANSLLITILIALASFLLNLQTIQQDGIAAFYSPLTRFWEILIGASLACYTFQKGAGRDVLPLVGSDNKKDAYVVNVLSILGAFLLALSVWLLDKDSAFPGFWALLPVAGTALIIFAGHEAWLNKYILSHKLVVWIGLISYPLYLWHWPLLVFPHIIVGEEPDWPMRAAAVVLSVLLAWLTYRFVEIPLRTSNRSGGLKLYTKALSASMVIVGCLGLSAFYSEGFPSRELAIKTAAISAAHKDHGSPEPGFKDGLLDLNEVNFVGEKTDAVLFLGDSLMANYFSRVEYLYSNASDSPIFSATFAPRSGCRPVPDGKGINSEGRRCDEYYAAVIKLAEAPKYKRIALSASWESVFSDGTYSSTGKGLMEDLLRLSEMGKDIFLISMAPFSPKLSPERLAKNIRLSHLSGGNATLEGDYKINRNEVDFLKQPAGILMRQMADSIGATVINPLDTLCSELTCRYVKDGEPLYVDAYHLRSSVARTSATYIDGLLTTRDLVNLVKTEDGNRALIKSVSIE